MELEIRRRESTGSGPNTYNESETLAKYEIMDGAPVRGESHRWNSWFAVTQHSLGYIFQNFSSSRFLRLAVILLFMWQHYHDSFSLALS